MALNLEELKFVVNTEDLDAAAKKIGALGDALSKVNKPTKQAAIDAEKLAKAQAVTAEATAKAELAATKAALAAAKLGKSQDSSTESSKAQISILEKQIMVLEYMAQGHSKGQASMLATAKVAGAVSTEIDELSKTLKTQRTLMGTDPFDKSIGALESWTNKLKVATEVEQLYNQSLGLTKAQMQELAIEKQRIIALAAMEGKSMQQVEAEYQKIIGIASTLAQKQNAITGTIKQQDKASSDAAKATAYLADADARLAAALDVSNAKLDKAGSDALVKYEKALRQTGMSSEEATAKLAKAKTQFNAIADKKQADKLQYLARAISVQMGDVGISLASGMNPLLVMIQQGDQIRGAIQQAGASGKQLEQAMAGAAGQIATSFMQTGQAIGGFFVNAIKSATKAVLGFPFALAKDGFISMFAGTETSAAAFQRLTTAAIAFSKVGIVVLIAALATLGKALYDALQVERELSINLATTGSSLQMNRASAIAYADSLTTAGQNTAKYVDVLSTMAKEGFKVGSNFKLIADSAISMEKYANEPIAKTVKAFQELADKPVEGITKLATEMRGVSPEVVKLVNELARQGKVAEAAAAATKEMARINSEAVKQIAADAGYLERIWLDVIDNIGKGWARVKGWALSWGTEDTLQAQLMAKQKELAGFKAGDNRALVTSAKTRIQNEIAGLQEQIDLQTKAKALREARDNKAKGEVEWQALLNKHLSKESEVKRDLAEIERAGLKAGKDAVEIQKLKNEYLAKQPKTAVTVLASKDLSIIQKDYNEQLRLAEGFAKDERSILKARFDAGLIERADFIAQDTDLLNRSEQKQLEVINNFTAKYVKAYEDQATLLAGAFTKAKDPENKKQLQEQLVNLTKDFVEFNATVEDTKAKLGSAFSSREQVALLEFEKAAFASTKTFKEYVKSQEDAAENKRIDLELSDRLANAYGAEAASIKAVADETKRQTAEVSKFTKAQEEAYKQYLIVLNNPNSSLAQLEAAGGAYTTAMINANKAIDIARTSIVQAGIDAEMDYYKKAYNDMRNGITDALVSALFEGGKTGSKKIRDLIIAELKKPITIVVKTLVEAVGGDWIKTLSSLASGDSSGLTNAMNGLKGIYDIYNTGLGGSVGSAVSTAGAMAGNASLGAYGTGMGLSSSAASAAAAQYTQAATAAAAAGDAAAAAQYTQVASQLQAGSSMGGTVSSVGNAAGGVAAGIYGGRAIGNGYSLSGGTGNGVVNLGTAIGSFWGPIGSAVGGMVGGLVNRAFGRKLVASGIQGTVGGTNGFSGVNYTFEKGGIFRNDKTRYSALAEGDRSGLANVFNLLKADMLALTKSVGTGSKTIENFSTSFKVNLKDLSLDQQAAAITSEFARIQEVMARAALGTNKYNQVGETYLQTLNRLSVFMASVNDVFGKLGFKLIDIKDGSLDATQAFVALFGGIEKFNTTFQYFYENFYTAAERTANLTSDLKAQFGYLGLELPKTREAFKQLVLGAKAAGNDQLVVNLLALQESFMAFIVPTEEAANAAKEYATALTNITTTIVDEINRLRGVNSSQAGLETQFTILTAQARAGDLTALEKLPDITKALEELAGATAVTATDVVLARARLAQSLQDTLGYVGMSSLTSSTSTVSASTSAVVSATGGTSTVSAASSNQELLSALITEVQGLRSEVRADVSYNAKTSKILERANQDGETLSVTVA